MPRQARQTRPQLVCMLADNSGSMSGPKAEAATMGIRDMLLRCQTTGPRGADRSYFRFVFIPFGTTASLECDMIPVRQIDADTITIRGDGGGTNIAEALEIAYSGLQTYMRTVVESHPERSDHPLPLVLLFSDGHNGYGQPEPIARQIKELNIDGDPVIVACAGVSTNASDKPDERLLRAIASPDCYVHIDNVGMLSAFLAEVGSSGASSPRQIAQIIKRLENLRGIED